MNLFVDGDPLSRDSTINSISGINPTGAETKKIVQKLVTHGLRVRPSKESVQRGREISGEEAKRKETVEYQQSPETHGIGRCRCGVN